MSKVQQFNAEVHQIIQGYLTRTQDESDYIANALKATISQFLVNTHTRLIKRAGDDDMVSSKDVIEAQIEELRKCIVDLELYLNRIESGATIQ